MTCPDKRALEALVAGDLTADEQDRLTQHLARCPDCTREAAFLSAVRIALPASARPGPECLSDEALAALADEAMTEDQRSQAVAHLTSCDHCLAGLAALVRALEHAEHEPISPPVHLLNQAIRKGAPGRSAFAAAPDTEARRPTTVGDLIFGSSLTWRLGLATGTAGLVLLLTVLLSSPGPEHPAIPFPAEGDEFAPTVAIAPQLSDTAPDTPTPGTPSVPVEDEPVNAKAPRPQPGPARTAPEPVASDWLAAATPEARSDLAADVLPRTKGPRPDLGTALADIDQAQAFSESYALGKALGFLERFGPHIGESADLKKLIADTLLSLEPPIHRSLPAGQSTDKLVAFASGLGSKIISGRIEPDSGVRRISVFTQALREALAERESTRAGLRLGLLVQGWQTRARAEKSGIHVPPQDAAAIERARRVIRGEQGLSEQVRSSVLDDLTRIEELHHHLSH